MRRRIWSETVDYARLASDEVVESLARFEIAPIVAVRPGPREGLREALEAFRARRLEPALWPMLDDRDGRWLNATNDERFFAFAREVARDLEGGFDEIAIDLEPPIAKVHDLLRGGVRAVHALGADVDRARFDACARGLGDLERDLGARGVRLSAALVPMVLAHPAWSFALGTPADAVVWKGASVMLYSSLFEGWSKGLLDRDDARALLAEGCVLARRRFGDRAGASLGLVGTGALGDEPVYRGPDEFADDVAIARAAGVDDLTLFDLGGLLARGSIDVWLRAFVETPPLGSLPSPTFRARATTATLRAAGATFAFFVRSSRS